jgi:hypothetical protein
MEGRFHNPDHLLNLSELGGMGPKLVQLLPVAALFSDVLSW